MEQLNTYTITPEKYEKLALLSDEIYNTSVIIAHFCNDRADVEELRNLAPIVNDLKKKSDKLNAEILNWDED